MYKIKEQSTTAFATFTGLRWGGTDYLFQTPVGKTNQTGLQAAILLVLNGAGFNTSENDLYPPVKVLIVADKLTIHTDKMELGDLYLLTNVGEIAIMFERNCPQLNVVDWQGKPTERVGVGNQMFQGDGTVVTLTPPVTANLAEINFIGGDGKYTLDGTNPLTSNTAQTQTDDVQFEVEEKTGLNDIKLTAPAGVTISVIYYYRPAGFNA
jgi:hypothetical protein